MTNQELIKRAVERTETKIQKIIKRNGDGNGERRTLYYFVEILSDEIKSMTLEQECCKKIEQQRRRKVN